MKKTLTLIMVVLAALVVATGCNSRVFVEDLAPSRTMVEIGMDGGTEQVFFGSRKWEITDILVNGSPAGGTVTEDGETRFMYQPVLKNCGKIELTLGDGSRMEIRKTGRKSLEVCMDTNFSLFRVLLFTVGNDVLSERLYFRQSGPEITALERIEWQPAAERRDTVLETGWNMTVQNDSKEEDIVFHRGIFKGCTKREVFKADEGAALWNLVKVPFSVPVPEKTDIDGNLVFGGSTAPFVPDVTETAMDSLDKEISIRFKPGKSTYEMIWEYVVFSARYKMYLKCANGDRLVEVTGTYISKTPDGKYYGIWSKTPDNGQ